MRPEKVRDILFGGTGGFDEDHMGIAYIEYSYREIGLTEAWFKETSAKIGDRLVIRRDILLQRLRGSSQSPYDQEDIEAIIDKARKPIRTITIGDFFSLDIYTELMREKCYIVGVDCATGGGGDNNAITIVDPYTEEPVAEFESPYIGEPAMERLLQELVMKYIPKAIVCIERNYSGSGIIKHLLESPIAGRIYFDRYKEVAEEELKQSETTESMLKAAAKMSTYYGVYTQQKSREAMFEVLGNRIANFKDKFVTQNITRDIAKLIRKGEKILAKPPFHDDSVMSYNIAMYVLRYGNNLGIFGFDRSSIIDTILTPGDGILKPEDIDASSLPDSVQEVLEVEKRRAVAVESYDDILRKNMLKSQRMTRMMAQKGIVTGTAYNNMPDQQYAEFEDYSDDILDFLRDGGSDISDIDMSLNGIGSNNYW